MENHVFYCDQAIIVCYAKSWASLTLWGLMTHICTSMNWVIIGSGNGLLLILCPTSSPYQNACWFIISWTISSKFQWLFSLNIYMYMYIYWSWALKCPPKGLHHFIKPSLCFDKYIDGLVQDCSISIANALEILQSCTKPSICTAWYRAIWMGYVQQPTVSNKLDTSK